MAKDKKEKNKYQGGPKRRRYLSRIAESGSGDGRGEYSKYSDIDPKDVHTGPATYGGNTAVDDPDQIQRVYSINVKRGHGKSYFRFQNKLYEITNTSGTQFSEIQV